MAIFKLEIRLDNAAFHDDDGDFDPYNGIQYCMSEVITTLGKMCPNKGPIRDVNGNLVGEWRIEE